MVDSGVGVSRSLARVPRDRCRTRSSLRRRHRALPVRRALGRRAARVRPGDRRLARAGGRQDDRRGLQLGHGDGAGRPPADAGSARDRRAHPGGARQCSSPATAASASGPPGHDREGPLWRRRAQRSTPASSWSRCPARAWPTPSSAARPTADDGRRVRGHCAPLRGRGQHGDPRLHALPADPRDAAARAQARRHPSSRRPRSWPRRSRRTLARKRISARPRTPRLVPLRLHPGDAEAFASGIGGAAPRLPISSVQDRSAPPPPPPPPPPPRSCPSPIRPSRPHLSHPPP